MNDQQRSAHVRQKTIDKLAKSMLLAQTRASEAFNYAWDNDDAVVVCRVSSAGVWKGGC